MTPKARVRLIKEAFEWGQKYRVELKERVGLEEYNRLTTFRQINLEYYANNIR